MPVALVRRQSSARTCTNSARTAESGRRPQTCAGSAEIRPCNPACVTTAAADSRRIRLSLQRNVFAQTLVIRNTKEFVRCVQHYAPVPKKKSKSLWNPDGRKKERRRREKEERGGSQAQDGYTYERVEIERWIRLKRDNAKSPMTNEILADTRLTKPRAESQHRRGARHRRLRGGPAAHKPEKAPREVLDSNFRCAQAAGAV